MASAASRDPFAQGGYRVRFDWGASGAARLHDDAAVLVIVDVLSFTTAVSVVVERGSAVYPAPWGDSRAEQLARDVDAVLATGRRAVTNAHPWSLSPAALRDAPFVPRLVLPSPNGSAIAAAATSTRTVAASLRNARAVGAWLAARHEDGEAPVVVIAAGEQSSDGSLRPALEDLLGAGAVISALAAVADLRLSPEAAAAKAVYEATPSVVDAVRGCASGIELASGHFEADLDIATDLDVSEAVPVLIDGAFRCWPNNSASVTARPDAGRRFGGVEVPSSSTRAE